MNSTLTMCKTDILCNFDSKHNLTHILNELVYNIFTSKIKFEIFDVTLQQPKFKLF